ncbi:TPA: hypothetical protein HA246_01090 [Candidatus Woesearchaeota archaeon]|nr:hypothetical protein [Candidatus Woesearchaeota archaeon]
MTDLAMQKDRFNASGQNQGINMVQNLVLEINNELNEHLEVINENTSEIQANYEYTAQLDSKIAKLNERLDNIQLFLRGLAKADDLIKEAKSESSYQIQPLTSKEKRLFLVLYTNPTKAFSYKDLVEKLGLPENLVTEYISSMIEKGVPLIKTYLNGKSYYSVDKQFRDHQTKTNILQITQRVLIA